MRFAARLAGRWSNQQRLFTVQRPGWTNTAEHLQLSLCICFLLCFGSGLDKHRRQPCSKPFSLAASFFYLQFHQKQHRRADTTTMNIFHHIKLISQQPTCGLLQGWLDIEAISSGSLLCSVRAGQTPLNIYNSACAFVFYCASVPGWTNIAASLAASLFRWQ